MIPVQIRKCHAPPSRRRYIRKVGLDRPKRTTRLEFLDPSTRKQLTLRMPSVKYLPHPVSFAPIQTLLISSNASLSYTTIITEKTHLKSYKDPLYCYAPNDLPLIVYLGIRHHICCSHLIKIIVLVSLLSSQLFAYPSNHTPTPAI